MAHVGMVKGLPPSLSNMAPSKCASCVLGKQTRTLVLKKHEEGKRAMRCLEIVWIDMIGPESVVLRTGNQYMLDIVDNYTNYVFSIPSKPKIRHILLSRPGNWRLRPRLEKRSGCTLLIMEQN